jgi:hypothetical protein
VTAKNADGLEHALTGRRRIGDSEAAGIVVLKALIQIRFLAGTRPGWDRTSEANLNRVRFLANMCDDMPTTPRFGKAQSVAARAPGPGRSPPPGAGSAVVQPAALQRPPPHPMVGLRTTAHHARRRAGQIQRAGHARHLFRAIRKRPAPPPTQRATANTGCYTPCAASNATPATGTGTTSRGAVRNIADTSPASRSWLQRGITALDNVPAQPARSKLRHRGVEPNVRKAVMPGNSADPCPVSLVFVVVSFRVAGRRVLSQFVLSARRGGWEPSQASLPVITVCLKLPAGDLGLSQGIFPL